MKVVLFILMVLFFPAAPSAYSGSHSGEKVNPPTFSLSVKEGKMTLRARDADLEKILQQLSRQAGFELFIYDDIGRKITIDINDLSLEEALKKLLPNYGFLFRRTPGGKLALRAVAVVRGRERAGKAPGGFVRKAVAQISYGNGPGELGRINLPEVERQGPQSFAVGPAGDIYLSDTINRRVQVYGPEGKLKRSIAVDGSPSDIAVSDSGDLFVMEVGRGVLLHFSLSGEKVSEIPISRAILTGLESFRTFGDSLLLRTRDQEEYVIPVKGGGKAVTVRGSRLTPDASCLVRKVSGSGGEVTIIGRGDKVLDTIPVPVERLASIVFLGRDKEKNLYLQVEQSRGDGPGVELGVLKLNPAGILLDKIQNIPNTYTNWTTRLLRVNNRGDIYQMLPGPEAVELNRWSIPVKPGEEGR